MSNHARFSSKSDAFVPIFLDVIFLGLMVSLCGLPLLSAQSAESNGVPVHMIVTVEPRKGSDVQTISRQDVLVSQNKQRDTVTEWAPAPADGSGLEFFILLDDSSNMTLGSQLDDIRKFADELPAAAKVGIAYMQNGMAQIVQSLTTDHAQAGKALRLPLGTPGGNGSPYFSLSDLVKRWPAGASRREVLMVSDGIDEYYGAGNWQDPYLDAAIEDAQRAGIIVSALYSPGAGHFGHSYYQTYWGQLYMSKLADRTGGESYYIGMTGPPVAFAPYLDDARSRLTHQYFLTFLAKPPKKAGLEQVRITTEVPNVDLVAAGQVYVPAAK
ncbi:MAG TPA: hypothetical protein VGG14_03240 [Candidatus Sulfotelmatobacter sp.]|jgi:hypothetical protein